MSFVAPFISAILQFSEQVHQKERLRNIRLGEVNLIIKEYSGFIAVLGTDRHMDIYEEILGKILQETARVVDIQSGVVTGEHQSEVKQIVERTLKELFG